MNSRDFAVWLAQAPPGTLVPARELATLLSRAAEEPPDASTAAPVRETMHTTWRERLWIVPPDTRLGVREVAEASGRSRDWVYKHTSAGGSGWRLPHRKLDGQLVFLAGEIRTWLAAAEQIVEPGTRPGLRVAGP
jgi:predicted DNA-binding transcriptional regulator AlpA